MNRYFGVQKKYKPLMVGFKVLTLGSSPGDMRGMQLEILVRVRVITSFSSPKWPSGNICMYIYIYIYIYISIYIYIIYII